MSLFLVPQIGYSTSDMELVAAAYSIYIALAVTGPVCWTYFDTQALTMTDGIRIFLLM